VQERRFQILLEMSNLDSGQSLLDVGCGFGDLAAWLAHQGRSVDYTGIDISPELLDEGRRQYPGLRLIETDLLDFDPPPGSYDWVWLSGTLNRNLEDNGRYARSVIARMFSVCRKGIAFNLLDARDEWNRSRWDLQGFHPEDIRLLVCGWSEDTESRDDYLKGDFSVVVKKSS